MTKEEIEARLIYLRACEADLRLQVRKYVQDKSIPLEERWQLFIDSNLGEERPFIVHWKAIDDDIINAGMNIFWYERNDEIFMEDVWNAMQEDDRKEEILKFYPDTNFDAFREEVLQKFIKSYRLDW